jgi:hypothetical protein
MATPAQGGENKKPDDFIDIVRRVGDETISSLRNEQRGDQAEEPSASSEAAPAEQDRSEFRSIFHDDENLQDEQDAFDADNASASDTQETDNDSTRQSTFTLGALYADPETRSGIWKTWMDEFHGKTLRLNSPEDYLKMVEAEADCIIWLGKIDLHRESQNAGEKDDKEMARLSAKAEAAFGNLRKLIASHGH